MAISLPTGEVGVDIFALQVKFAVSNPWINISDEATSVSGIEASTSVDTVSVKTGSGRNVRFQATPDDTGVLTTQIDLLFNVLTTSFYQILLKEWQDARANSIYPDIWLRVRPGKHQPQRRWFYTSKNWSSMGSGKVTAFSYYNELSASTNNDIVRSSFTVSYDAVFVKTLGGTLKGMEDNETVIQPNEYFGLPAAKASSTEKGKNINDVIALDKTHISSNKVQLSATPSLHHPLRVIAMGVPQWEAKGDFSLLSENGKAFISWKGKALQSILQEGDILEASYTVA